MKTSLHPLLRGLSNSALCHQPCSRAVDSVLADSVDSYMSVEESANRTRKVKILSRHHFFRKTRLGEDRAHIVQLPVYFFLGTLCLAYPEIAAGCFFTWLLFV